ncbi:Uncharacterised protein [BD1-7 clade bacterium]|nr:Uncharacterised protein [BD1-7 clade bacterium]
MTKDTANMPDTLQPCQQDGRRKKRPGVEEQQQVIVGAAIPLFLDEGTEAVSIARICKQANVSRPTFYRCFDDKGALLAAIYQQSVTHAVSEFLDDELFADAPDIQHIRLAFEQMYQAIFADADSVALLFRESANPNSAAYNIVYRAFENAADKLLGQLPQGMTPDVDKTCLMSVMAANQWIVHNAIIQGLSDDAKQTAIEAGWQLVRRLFFTSQV